MRLASSISVLTVDDQVSIRAALTASLKQIGFSDVMGAKNGEDAIKLLRNMPFRLVISDFNMPGMDGLALLHAVRSDPELKKIAFVMLTSQATRELVQKAVQGGVNNFIPKPFTTESIKHALERVLGPLAPS
ncbi:chemotaxis protein CheY [Ameyamaea chiangmaiensis NBRC 103196]|uniref:Response regulator n=1 Tax=Ameyamaea chiangmaiensis TaxID=442969 RepID=A0A850PAZ5_9PROT|nr:response regulator [Ameyamaea chiangmaiensis]MBS4076019.1 response regulator [Ameyamaea chiangmaiensis]NVN40113.1 response regulator [Ameyamaea chiangmaiensis]GBQ61440.1 chemotaxis protein CheY [Ameyamaea chiangmaiensis NBRC 103196]